MDFGIARAMADAPATMTADGAGHRHRAVPLAGAGPRRAASTPAATSTPSGCLLFELLTGRPPFAGDSPVAIAYQHVREDAMPPSHFDPDVPAWADAIVLKALAKDPADRYQTADDMRADLQRALPGCRWRPRRRPGSTCTRRPSGWGRAR